MNGRRGLIARFLLAATLVGATAVHRHSILEDASSARHAPPTLDPRCALGKTLSLHAISRIVEREVCWTCHWQRVFAVPSHDSFPGPEAQPPFAPGRPCGAADRLALLAGLSRGPPSLS